MRGLIQVFSNKIEPLPQAVENLTNVNFDGVNTSVALDDVMNASDALGINFDVAEVSSHFGKKK